MAMSITRYAGRVERFRAGTVDVVLARGAREHLASQILDEVRGHADRAVVTCNASSTWGGYWAWHGDRQSRVYSANGGRDSDRGRRMLQAVGGLS